ncbi:MAG: FAD-dependent oxidoreductase [Holosporales bacterium]|jgi:thioredoxin reductase (NADPH)|nr:FAD-dependent oxidoreductase [Holosporales bacterium]
MISDTENTTIIGSGPAGLTAGIYLARAGLRPVIIAGNLPGGQLVNSDMIENYPGFDVINGADLMAKMLSQAEACDVRIVYDAAINVSKADDLFITDLVSGDKIISRSVVVATGARHRLLGVPGEAEFTNKGVSWCATCDGPMYRGKLVAVIGGGNTAAMEASFLANFASTVYLIHRRGSLRADKVMQDRLFFKHNIKYMWDSEVAEIIGSNRVEAIKVTNNITGAEALYDVNGIFIAIGTTPSSDCVGSLVSLDSGGYIKSDNTKTTCAGIFVAGDVASGSLKQAIYAAGQGALASKYVEEYLDGL